MVTLEIEMVMGLITVVVFTWLCLFGAVFILRRECGRRRICTRLVNTRIRYVLLIMIVGAILSFIVGNNVIEAYVERHISASLGHLKTCDTLKIRNSFYDRGSVSATPVIEDIRVNDAQAIKKVADILGNSQYRPLMSWGGPSRIGTEELMDIYVYNQQVEVDRLRVIAGYVLIIDKDSARYRYRSLDDGLLDKLRQVVGAGGDWAATRD